MKHTLHILSWFTAFVWLAATTAHAQTVGTCATAEAEAFLDINNVRARIFNNGVLFYQSGKPHVYEVPKSSGSNAIFAASIWLGGLVEGALRIAASRYNGAFWPGPLDDNGNPPADCTPYDRLWEITRADLITYAESGTPTRNLADWPWRLGAPVLDGDGNPDNYNLDGGDRPALIGDQMLWWVMNDAGNEHLFRSVSTPPIGIEVHGSAFAFSRPSALFGNATFYRYVLRYKGAEPLHDTYFGVFFDPDLGYSNDDYVGSDTTLHLGYAYNGDNDDEGEHGYGTAPPAVGYTFLRTPVANDGRDNNRDGTTDEPGEMLGMTHFLFYFAGGGCVICSPASAQDHYLYLQARLKDGQPLTVGGTGHNFSDIPTTYSFPGDPATGAFWSAVNIDGVGTALEPSDVQFVTSTGPFTMQPGDEQEITFAIVWARGTNHLDSVRQLKKDVKRLREVADEILQVALPPQPAPPPEPSYGLGFVQNFPNPFSASTTIRYSLPQPIRVRLKVFDVLGREVATLVDAQQDGGLYEIPFEAGELPDGVYFYRLQLDYWVFTRKMVLMR